jgi:hypothetical protein
MRRSAAAASSLLLAGLFALAGCARAPRGAAVPGADPGARFYQLDGGIFDRVAGPADPGRRPARPWTVQERIADLAFLGGTLWLAVNGHGLAAVVPGDPPSFAARYDDWLFPQRTVTTLLARDGRLLCHLYFNTTLNTVARTSLKAEGISFLAFDPGIDDFAVLLPPFQRANPAWEAVGAAPLADGEFLVEWKLAAGETSFAWTRFAPATKAEGPSTREAYQKALAYAPADGPDVSSGVQALFAVCAERLAASGTSAGDADSIVFVVRDRTGAARRAFRSGTGDAFVTVPVFLDAASGSALLPDGSLVVVRADGTRGTLALPKLPAGFRYTDLARSNGYLVVPWEEVRFPNVGAAGILLYAAKE